MAYPPQSELKQATEPRDHVILSEAKDLLLGFSNEQQPVS